MDEMDLQHDVITKPAAGIPHRRMEKTPDTPPVMRVGKRTIQILDHKADLRFIRKLGVPALGQTIGPELDELIGKPAHDLGIERISVVVQEHLPEILDAGTPEDPDGISSQHLGGSHGRATVAATAGGTVVDAVRDSGVVAPDLGDPVGAGGAVGAGTSVADAGGSVTGGTGVAGTDVRTRVSGVSPPPQAARRTRIWGEERDEEWKSKETKGTKHGAPCSLEWLVAEAIHSCWAAGGTRPSK